MIATTVLDGVIGSLKRARRRLLHVEPSSPHAREVAEIVAEAERLLAELESLKTRGDGRPSQAA